mmetsp:Transcript_14357/g.28357  ORF Transcript_14357/g.28357 Transcript_14357/m.28357 type:complete len:109 (-) Transcript_14357:1255-1581(-)
MRVTSDGLDLEHAVVHGDERHIAGAPSEIVDEHVLFAGLTAPVLHAIGPRGRRLLAHNTNHIQTSHGPCVFRRRALRKVEMGRHSDHTASDNPPQNALSTDFHLGEDH